MHLCSHPYKHIHRTQQENKKNGVDKKKKHKRPLRQLCWMFLLPLRFVNYTYQIHMNHLANL